MQIGDSIYCIDECSNSPGVSLNKTYIILKVSTLNNQILIMNDFDNEIWVNNDEFTLTLSSKLNKSTTTYLIKSSSNIMEGGGTPFINSEIKNNNSYNSVSKNAAKNAAKNDKNKPKLSWLTKESLEAEAKVLEFGANKYDKNNYKLGLEWSRVLDACLRHIYAFSGKENIDKESGMNHLWHAKANLAMLIYYYENNKGTDDR